jgi:hypothetical protein
MKAELGRINFRNRVIKHKRESFKTRDFGERVQRRRGYSILIAEMEMVQDNYVNL